MNKLKKLLTISLSVLLMLCVSITFSVCDNPANSSCKHTYEWVGNEGGHQKVYTCGCEYPDIAELHRDNNSDYVCDVCGWSIDGILPEIVPETLVEKSYFDMIDELQISDIKKIETVEYAGSVAPNIRKPIEYKTSTRVTDIERVYVWLKSLQGALTKIPDEEAQLEGTGTKIFTIYTAQNYFAISDVGRNYLNIGGVFYGQEGETPEIAGETVTYKFESYYDEAELYIDGEKVGNYDFEFDKIVCKETWGDFARQQEYKLVASIGELIIYDETHFNRNGVKYEIVEGSNFSKIIEDFPLQNDKLELLRVAYQAEYPYAKVYVKNYYGEYESGALVAMMEGDGYYNDAGWTVVVAGHTFEYNNGNRIIVLYNGKFYGLEFAYENGYLTKDEIGDIALKHRKFYLVSGSDLCDEHTYEWDRTEGGHRKVYTCGCYSPAIEELHRDNDENAYCDVCGWYMPKTLPEDYYLFVHLILAYEEK